MHKAFKESQENLNSLKISFLIFYIKKSDVKNSTSLFLLKYRSNNLVDSNHFFRQSSKRCLQLIIKNTCRIKVLFINSQGL